MKGIALPFPVCSLYIFYASSKSKKYFLYYSKRGEKVLRLEMVVNADKENAWNYFTKDKLLQKWMAPLAHIELKNGWLYSYQL